jgi:hypothetical protein
MVMITEDIPALVVFLDPGNMAIQVPNNAEGPGVMARLAREIEDSARKLAEMLELKHGLVGGKHHLAEPSWFNDSGAGSDEARM